MSVEGQETSQEEEISRKIKTYKCRYCGEGPFTLPKLGTHSKTCPERLKAIAKVKRKPEGEGEVRPPSPPEVAEARQIVAQFGREGLNKIKRGRLRSVLDMAPGVSKKSVPWILHKWDVNARLRDDPMEFWRMLHDDAGLKPNMATSIVRDVFSLEEEFADLLYRRGEQPIFFRPYGAPQTQPYPGQPPFYPATPPYQQQPFQYPPQPGQPPRGAPGYYPQYPYPPPQKDEIGEVKKYIDKKFEELKPKEEQYVTIEEPLRNAEGLILLGPDEKPITRKIRTPVSQAAQLTTGDPEERILNKLKTYKELFKPEKEPITPEKIRAIIKEESGKEPKTPPITKEDLEKASTKAAETVLAKKAEEDKDERRHRETLEAIRTLGGSKVVEGYKSDSYRFLGQSLDKLATVIEKKEPVKVIIQGVRDILSEGPPAKEVEAGAKTGIFEHVKPEYVVEA